MITICRYTTWMYNDHIVVGVPSVSSYMRYSMLSYRTLIGCVSDLVINTHPVSLYSVSKPTSARGITLGCADRTEGQCSLTMCYTGLCQDMWTTYECLCPAGWSGPRYVRPFILFGASDSVVVSQTSSKCKR